MFGIQYSSGTNENGFYICTHLDITIYGFLKHFDIPRDVFENYCYNTGLIYKCDYNIDILYSGDEELIDSYYSKVPDNIEELKLNYGEWLFKLFLRQNVKENPAVQEWLDSIKNSECKIISIPDMVYRFNISRETFEKLLYRLHECNDMYGYTVPNYDIDRIYNDREGMEKAIAAVKTVKDIYEIDKSLRIPR